MAKKKMSREALTANVKEVARRYGAVLVGVAPVERFDPMPPVNDKAPVGHHPKDFLPETRSVVSIAMPIMNPVVDAPANLAVRELDMIPNRVKYPYMEMLYNRVGHVMQDVMLEHIAQLVGQYLMSEGYDAMVFPTTGLHPHVEGLTDSEIWEEEDPSWSKKKSPFGYTFGAFSHRHAATRAGLGEFGYNNIVLTRQFGPRQRWNSILTEVELEPDPADHRADLPARQVPALPQDLRRRLHLAARRREPEAVPLAPQGRPQTHLYRHPGDDRPEALPPAARRPARLAGARRLPAHLPDPQGAAPPDARMQALVDQWQSKGAANLKSQAATTRAGARSIDYNKTESD